MSITFTTTRERRGRKSSTFATGQKLAEKVSIGNVQLKDKRFCGFDGHRENKFYAFHVVSGNWQRTDRHSH